MIIPNLFYALARVPLKRYWQRGNLGSVQVNTKQKSFDISFTTMFSMERVRVAKGYLLLVCRNMDWVIPWQLYRHATRKYEWLSIRITQDFGRDLIRAHRMDEGEERSERTFWSCRMLEKLPTRPLYEDNCLTRWRMPFFFQFMFPQRGLPIILIYPSRM
jgi:hypothetical protein